MTDLHGDYDQDNIFAKIMAGEIPSAKVFEDDLALVIMDAFPQAKGHCLVIPRAASRNLLDAAPETLAHCIQLTQRVARAVAAALEADGVRVMQFNGSAAGQSVFHLHFHVIPMREDEALGRHGGGQADAKELAALAEKIAAHMG